MHIWKLLHSTESVWSGNQVRSPAPQRPLTNHCSNPTACRSSRGRWHRTKNPGNTPAGNTWTQNSVFTKSMAFAKTGNSEKIHSGKFLLGMGRAQASSRENVRIQTKVLRPCLEIKGSQDQHRGWCRSRGLESTSVGTEEFPRVTARLTWSLFSTGGNGSGFLWCNIYTWFTSSTTLPSCHHFCSSTKPVRTNGRRVSRWSPCTVKTFPTSHTCNRALRTMPSEPASSSFFLVPTEAPHPLSRG